MSSTLPAPLIGYLFLAASALLLALGAHSILFSALYPSHALLGGGGGGTVGEWQWQWQRPIIIIIDIMIAIINAVLDALARDAHYKYLALFSVPVCAYFVIANWVGWQFFRNS
jgi:Phosphatidylinositol N-acetylglucosaminyltransferase subunit Y